MGLVKTSDVMWTDNLLNCVMVLHTALGDFDGNTFGMGLRLGCTGLESIL